MPTLSPSIQAVLDVFQGALAEVRFADIDAGALARLAAEVETTAGEVEAQEAKLGEMRQALSQRQELLLVHAQRALAYARVYAENDLELSEKLNAISLARAVKRAKSATTSAGGRDTDRPADSEGAGRRVVEASTQLDYLRLEPPPDAAQRRGKRREMVDVVQGEAALD